MTEFEQSAFEQSILANINAAWTAVAAIQSAYHQVHGKFCQCLWSHSSPPIDGQSAHPDNLLSVPVHQTDDWVTSGAALLLGDAPRVRVRIDISTDWFALLAQYRTGDTIHTLTKRSDVDEATWLEEDV